MRCTNGLPDKQTVGYTLLELVAISGELPANQLCRLPGGDSYKLNVVRALKSQKLLRTYVCDRYPRCDSYVGAHKRTKEPMGTLANGDLRNKRIQAHKAFDWMWKSGLMTKWQAYKWMQGKLALTDEQAHIAKFSEYMCDRLIIECNKALENQRIAA